MNHSGFESKTELFNIIHLHCTLQPATLVNFQKNKVKHSVRNCGPAEKEKPDLPLSHSTQEKFLWFPIKSTDSYGALVMWGSYNMLDETVGASLVWLLAG